MSKRTYVFMSKKEYIFMSKKQYVFYVKEREALMAAIFSVAAFTQRS